MAKDKRAASGGGWTGASLGGNLEISPARRRRRERRRKREEEEWAAKSGPVRIYNANEIASPGSD